MKITLILFLYLFSLLLSAQPAGAQVITTIAGNGTPGYTGNGGPAVDAEISYAMRLFIDHAGNVFVADGGNNVLRKINTSGIITVIAGNGMAGTSGDGGYATMAEFHGLSGVAVDDTGSIYVSDVFDCVIRKVDTFGIITRIAGNDTCGFAGDGGAATDAELDIPGDIAIDNSGNLFIADYNNNRIRKLSASGIITTIAGNGTPGFMGDGSQATAAELNNPVSVAIDNDDNIYFGDEGNNRVRKINGAGIITTIAGNGTGGFSGDGMPATSAEITGATGLAVDSIGNIYLADASNNRIRKVDTAGIISTIVGTGVAGFNGNGIPLLSAQLNNPDDVKLDRSGNFFIADDAGNRIRTTMLPDAVKTLNSKLGGISIFPNPGSKKFVLLISTNIAAMAQVIVCDVIGTQIMAFEAATNRTTEFQLNVPGGVYYISAQTAQDKFTQKIIIQH